MKQKLKNQRKKETERECIMKITLLVMVLQRKRINRRDKSTERLNRGCWRT